MRKQKRLKKKLLYNIARKIKMLVFDFDGVFTDNRVLVMHDGKEAVFCCRSDGIGLSAIKKLGIHLVVISSEVNPIVSSRCQKLGVRCIQGCENKLEILVSEAKRLNIFLKEVAYLGNDVNDIDCLRNVGLPACVKESHPDVLISAYYITKLRGGKGAVREFCDLITRAKNEKKC